MATQTALCFGSRLSSEDVQCVFPRAKKYTITVTDPDLRDNLQLSRDRHGTSFSH